MNLAEVERDLHSTEQLKVDLETNLSERENDTRKINLLNEEKANRTEAIKSKYRKQVSALSNEMHLLEIQLRQYPAMEKNMKVEHASWMRKEEEWKNRQLEEIEIKIGGEEKKKQKCVDNEEALKKEREKRIAQISDERRRAEKKERDAVDGEIRIIGEEITGRRVDVEAKKEGASQVAE